MKDEIIIIIKMFDICRKHDLQKDIVIINDENYFSKS